MTRFLWLYSNDAIVVIRKNKPRKPSGKCWTRVISGRFLIQLSGHNATVNGVDRDVFNVEEEKDPRFLHGHF
jgi:hypothetical protein